MCIYCYALPKGQFMQTTFLKHYALVAKNCGELPKAGALA